MLSGASGWDGLLQRALLGFVAYLLIWEATSNLEVELMYRGAGLYGSLGLPVALLLSAVLHFYPSAGLSKQRWALGALAAAGNAVLWWVGYIYLNRVFELVKPSWCGRIQLP